MSKLNSLQEMQILVQKGFASCKTAGDLCTFKYDRRVMYNYLWGKIDGIEECRGHTYDFITGDLVLCPFTKSFNYLENETWKDAPLNTVVTAFKKYNGYMASATVHNHKIIVGTTGTTSSDYAKYAKELILASEYKDKLEEGYTHLFEVIAPWDKHIVDEFEGLYLLGIRNNKTGGFHPRGISITCTLQEMLDYSKIIKHEGWMLYSPEYGVCKLKTEYYVGKKKLMRITPSQLEKLYKHSSFVDTLPDYWKFAVEYIKKDFPREEFECMIALDRREYLESIDLERVDHKKTKEK